MMATAEIPAEINGRQGRFFLTFPVVFALTYFVCWGANLALFSYMPQIGEWAWGTVNATSDAGPAMYYWGWMAYAGIAGSLAGLMAAALPHTWAMRLRLGWLLTTAPVAVFAGVVYLSRHWFA